MLTIGTPFPSFRLQAVAADMEGDCFVDLDQDTYAGRWQVFVFYPKDFTFVCPTEIAGFAALNDDFAARGAHVMVASTDSAYVHLAWRRAHPHLRELPFPMLSDIRRDLSGELGILDPDEGVCQRATFVVDPEGVIRHVSVYDGSVGRNPREVLRILEALQTDELTPCNWQPGEETLQVA
jgi:peroxiredoxin (alkyl hydroperoxide reductase subunit C)